MTKVETNGRKVIERLQADGWANIGGGSHDRFVHKDRPEIMIVVPPPPRVVSGRCALDRQGGGMVVTRGAKR